MDLISNFGNISELTIQGILLVGIFVVYRDSKRRDTEARDREAVLKKEFQDREEEMQKRLDDKDKCIFDIMDKNSVILNKLEKIYENR